jgi:hypothetical protein
MESLSFSGSKSTHTGPIAQFTTLHLGDLRKLLELHWHDAANGTIVPCIREKTMKRIPTLAFAIVLAVTPILASVWFSHEAYAATAQARPNTAKARAECNQRAILQNLTTRSVRRSHVLGDCMRERGFSGPP